MEGKSMAAVENPTRTSSEIKEQYGKHEKFEGVFYFSPPRMENKGEGGQRGW